MGVAGIFKKNKMEKAPLPKISVLNQLVGRYNNIIWWLHTKPSKIDLDHNVYIQVNFRKISMKS